MYAGEHRQSGSFFGAKMSRRGWLSFLGIAAWAVGSGCSRRVSKIGLSSKEMETNRMKNKEKRKVLKEEKESKKRNKAAKKRERKRG